MGYGKLAKGISEEEAKRKLQKVMPSQERKKSFQGTSPSIFIGSHNYPKVNTGVLSPQQPLGSSGLMDSPKNWYRKKYSIEKIASLRTSLVNSKERQKVKNPGNFAQNTREIAMAKKPVNIEVELEKRPGQSISGGRAKPVSASGDVEAFNLGENPTVERKIEDMFYDREAKAETAIDELHDKGVDKYQIQQSFTAGMLGEEKNRELVPTRWSITATDDMISKKLRKQVKNFQELGQIEYYNNEYVGNDFHIFLIPGRWEYELIEMKRPGSVWNAAENTYIAQNYEPYSGRTSYAEQTAGAFYAARLGTLEHLKDRKRQAKALILRDVSPEYWAPLGVWIIRETMRNAFNEKKELNTFKDVKQTIGTEFKFLYHRLKQKSKMIGSRQASITDF
ncbi:MAG: hypothetical protein BRC30_03275 [Nanohaloarchaea archaeon SW_7_46_7]|nr:MAG: hypothetical protein BRC30_03275 [Nanohaloarchaea archaeon SW_7_46_7]